MGKKILSNNRRWATGTVPTFLLFWSILGTFTFLSKPYSIVSNNWRWTTGTVPTFLLFWVNFRDFHFLSKPYSIVSNNWRWTTGTAPTTELPHQSIMHPPSPQVSLGQLFPFTLPSHRRDQQCVMVGPWPCSRCF